MNDDTTTAPTGGAPEGNTSNPGWTRSYFPAGSNPGGIPPTSPENPENPEPANAVGSGNSGVRYLTSTDLAAWLVNDHAATNILVVADSDQPLIWNGRWRWDTKQRELKRITTTALKTLRKAAESTSTGTNNPAKTQRESQLRIHTIGKFLAASGIKGIVEMVPTEATTTVTTAQLDREPMLLGAPNAVVDLATGKGRPWTREDLITRVTGVDFEADATCPRWERFLDEVFNGDAEVINYMQRVIGYALTGSVEARKMWILQGNGANGKSKFLHTVQQLLGDYAQSLPRKTLISNGSTTGVGDDIVRLAGARFATLSESDAGESLNEAQLKALVSGDIIAARALYGTYKDLTPTAKLFLATNHLPTIRSRDNGIWQRLVVVPFTQTFEVTGGDALAMELAAELPGILAWAVRGAHKWANGDRSLTPPISIRGATSDYKQDQDHIGQFLEATYTVDANGKVSAQQLRTDYEAWCKDNGDDPWSPNKVGKALRDHDLVNKPYGTLRRKHWHGIAATTS